MELKSKKVAKVMGGGGEEEEGGDGGREEGAWAAQGEKGLEVIADGEGRKNG